jgi:serine/threonine-protein kinase
MGEVWLSRLPGLGGVHKVCVVKKMLSHLSDDTTFVKRFLDEAKVVVHLNHGNICQIFEMGEVDGEYFMAMEFIDGKTVARITSRLRERTERFPLPLALYIGARACDALAYAHRKVDLQGRPMHVVHRDVSPSNVMVSYSGEVKVIDFGAAQSSLKEAHTAPRVVIGNLAYMSPEQARKRPVDGRADVYSVAVVLWELIAWQALPTGGDHVERWRRAAFPRFTPPSKLQSDVPPFIDQIIMRGLAQDPVDRYANAEALRDELQRALTQVAAKTSQTTLATLMAALFKVEAEEERALVARALTEFDPDSTERSKRHSAQTLDPEEITIPAGAPSGYDHRQIQDAVMAAVREVERRPPAPPPARLAPPVRQSGSPPPRQAPAPVSPPASAEEDTASTASDERRVPAKPPPPVPEPPRSHKRQRGSEEMPTITWAQPSRRRRFSDSIRTIDYPAPGTVRTVILRLLLFFGAFITGVVIAIAAYELFAQPGQPEPTPPGAPVVKKR